MNVYSKIRKVAGTMISGLEIIFSRTPQNFHQNKK